MFLEFRDVAKFFRGDATPFQLFATTILAGILSFLPGFREAPGLMLGAFLLFLILNTNFFVAGLVALAGKLLGLLLQPVSFSLGRFLIDDAATPLFTRLINGPVTAWFGFENYVATGGLILGGLYGFLTGMFVVSALGLFRRRMVALSQSDGMGSPLVRLGAWLFFGEKAGEDWETLAKRKVGKPVRVVGVVVTLLVIGAGIAAPYLANERWMARLVGSRLSLANGATVNLEAVRLDPAAGDLTLQGLAAASPNDLSVDTLKATTLRAKLSTSDLLARKVALDRLEISGARIGEPRERPGRRVGKPPRPSSDPVPSGGGETGFSIQGTLEEAEEWKERLSQVKKWLDRFSGGASPAGVEVGSKSLEERLRRQAEELGSHRVVASHRVREKPRFTIHELVARDVRVRQLPDEIFDITGSALSTQPQLLPGASTLEAVSRSGAFRLTLTLDQDEGPVAFQYDELSVETVRGWLEDASRFPFEGGHFRLEAKGTYSGGEVNLPIQVTPVGSQIRIGSRLQPAPQVPFRLLLTGALDNPRIRPELKATFKGMKDQLLDQGTTRLKEKLDDGMGNRLKGLFRRDSP